MISSQKEVRFADTVHEPSDEAIPPFKCCLGMGWLQTVNKQFFIV
jgi:hypothetical protein